MTHLIDPRTADLDTQNLNQLGALLAYQNAYRVKKKALISEIERSLGFDPGDAVPSLSAN